MPELADVVGEAFEVGLAELLRQRLQQALRPANPAVGTDFALSVPAGVAWELIALRATLTTSIVVANRVPVLRLSDATGVLVDLPPTIVQAASLVQVYEWVTAYPQLNVGSPAIAAVMPAPAILLPENGKVASLTTAIDVGDQWSSIVAVVRQWSLTDLTFAGEWYGRREWVA